MVESSSRQEDELKRKYFHRVKYAVDRGLPKELANVSNAAQAKDVLIQSRQRNKKYSVCNKGIKPRPLKGNGHERP